MHVLYIKPIMKKHDLFEAEIRQTWIAAGLISLTSHTDRNYDHALRAAQQLGETQATGSGRN
jgi:hypothetical protein